MGWSGARSISDKVRQLVEGLDWVTVPHYASMILDVGHSRSRVRELR
jgi:hypothetical protein